MSLTKVPEYTNFPTSKIGCSFGTHCIKLRCQSKFCAVKNFFVLHGVCVPSRASEPLKCEF
jgi:hypothetical protein